MIVEIARSLAMELFINWVFSVFEGYRINCVLYKSKLKPAD
jgi:hypothetical protein